MPVALGGRPAGVTNGLPLAGRYTPPGPAAPLPTPAAPPGLPRSTIFTPGGGGWNVSHNLAGQPAQTLAGLSIDDALANFGGIYSGGPTAAPIQSGPTPAPPGQMAPAPMAPKAPPLQTVAPPMGAPRLSDARNWTVGGR